MYASHHDGVGSPQCHTHHVQVAGDGTDSGDVAVMLLEQLVEAKGEYTFDGYELYWRKEILENGWVHAERVMALGRCARKLTW